MLYWEGETTKGSSAEEWPNGSGILGRMSLLVRHKRSCTERGNTLVSQRLTWLLERAPAGSLLGSGKAKCFPPESGSHFLLHSCISGRSSGPRAMLPSSDQNLPVVSGRRPSRWGRREAPPQFPGIPLLLELTNPCFCPHLALGVPGPFKFWPLGAEAKLEQSDGGGIRALTCHCPGPLVHLYHGTLFFGLFLPGCGPASSVPMRRLRKIQSKREAVLV